VMCSNIYVLTPGITGSEQQWVKLWKTRN